MGLLKLIENRLFGVGTHAGDAGLVKRPARSGWMRVSANVLRAGGLQHFASGIAHVPNHGAFVFTVGHVDSQDGNSVDIFHMGIEFDEIIPARQDFAETSDGNRSARNENSFLISNAESGSVPIEIRGGLPFIAVAAEESLVLRRVGDVAEARDVHAHGLVGGPRWNWRDRSDIPAWRN